MGDTTQGQVEKILQELGHKIDQLIEDAKYAKEEVREEVEGRIKDLKKKKVKLEDELNDFKTKNEGTWDDVKHHLKTAAEELKKAAEAVFRKKD